MSTSEIPKYQPHIPLLYDMVISFFETARIVIDPVLQAIDGFRELATDHTGRPLAPDHVAQRMAQLPHQKKIRCFSSSLVASTNLGLANAHSFRLLSFLTKNKDSLPTRATNPQLIKLFDAHPTTVRDELSSLYQTVGSHDIVMEINDGPFSDESIDDNLRDRCDLRSTLVGWQKNNMLSSSHRSFSGTGIVRLLIPLRSIFLLNHIIAEQIAPKLGQSYNTMDGYMSSRTKEPEFN